MKEDNEMKLMERKRTQPDEAPVGSIEDATRLNELSAVQAATDPSLATGRAYRAALARCGTLREIIHLQSDPVAVCDAREELRDLTERQLPRLHAAAEHAERHLQAVRERERATMERAFQRELD